MIRVLDSRVVTREGRPLASPVRYSFLALLALFAGLGQGPLLALEETDQRKIEEVFQAYKSALVAGDGQAAAALVDRETFEYFDEVRKLAVEGTPIELEASSFIDRLLVASLRTVMEPDEMQNIELADLISRAVGEGWISPQVIAQLGIGEVSVSGDEATAVAVSALVAGAQQEPQSEDAASNDLLYRFVREQGAWRFRFASLVASLDGLIADFVAQLGTDEEALIFMLVESFSGQKVLPEIWERPTG